MPYLAIYSSVDGGVSGSFPDFPGAVASGRDVEELSKHLSEVLALHINLLIEDGCRLPDVPISEVDDLESFESMLLISPAEINPVSKVIREEILSTGKSLRQLEKETGIGYSVLSRLQDPFYWGHTVRSIKDFADKLNLRFDFTMKPK